MSETRRSGLQKRYAEAQKTKDSGGGGQIFNFPTDTKFYKPREATNRIIIVPYTIKTKKHPMVAQGKYEIGEIDCVMDVWVHQRVGAGEMDMVCLKKNYLKACPVCEQAEEYKAKGMEKEYKALKPSRRVIYNVLDARDVEKGLMIFSTSHYLFEKELVEEAIAAGGERGMVDYAGIERGKIVRFRGATTSIERVEFLEFKSFSFEDREDDITAKELDNLIEKRSISLDEIMKVMTYDEMQAALYGQGDGDEETRSRSSSRDTDRDERLSRRDREEDDSEHRRHRDGDDEKKSEDPRREDVCPFDYVFGEDWDRKKECARCKVWDKCEDAYRKIKKEKE